MLPNRNSSTVVHWTGPGTDAVSAERELEIVIPFTTLQNTQRSIKRAEWLCSGLNAGLRVVRVLEAPYPLDLDRPCVAESAAKAEMKQLESELPIRGEIWCSRCWIDGFLQATPPRSLVILTCRRCLFFTAEQRLARALKKAGRRVSMFQEVDSRV